MHALLNAYAVLLYAECISVLTPQCNIQPRGGREKRLTGLTGDQPACRVQQGAERLTGIGGLSSCSCRSACVLLASCSHSDSDWNSCRRSLTCVDVGRLFSGHLQKSVPFTQIYLALQGKKSRHEDKEPPRLFGCGVRAQRRTIDWLFLPHAR